MAAGENYDARLPLVFDCPPRSTRSIGLQQIDCDQDRYPDSIDKVPIHRSSLDSEVVLWCEMAAEGAYERHEEDDKGDSDVGGMEAGDGEERRTIDVRPRSETNMCIFPSRSAKEANTKEHSKDGPNLVASPIAASDCPTCEMLRNTTGQEEYRVDERQSQLEVRHSFGGPLGATEAKEEVAGDECSKEHRFGSDEGSHSPPID